jgi:hypothetical protein
MTRYKREINKEIYDRAMERNGHITKEDEEKVFSPAEIWGYGVYGTKVLEEDGKYYVYFDMRDSCE